MNYLGIDPGPKSGGLVIVTNRKEVYAITAMPATEHDLCDFLKEHANTISMAWIEKVHAFPKQGVVSAFNFGDNYGMLRGVMSAFDISFEVVQPLFWQRRLEVPKKGKEETKTVFKNRLKGIAQRMYPGVPLIKATADALLIAEACRREHGLRIVGERK